MKDKHPPGAKMGFNASSVEGGTGSQVTAIMMYILYMKMFKCLVRNIFWIRYFKIPLKYWKIWKYHLMHKIEAICDSMFFYFMKMMLVIFPIVLVYLSVHLPCVIKIFVGISNLVKVRAKHFLRHNLSVISRFTVYSFSLMFIHYIWVLNFNYQNIKPSLISSRKFMLIIWWRDITAIIVFANSASLIK